LQADLVFLELAVLLRVDDLIAAVAAVTFLRLGGSTVAVDSTAFLRVDRPVAVLSVLTAAAATADDFLRVDGSMTVVEGVAAALVAAFLRVDGSTVMAAAAAVLFRVIGSLVVAATAVLEALFRADGSEVDASVVLETGVSKRDETLGNTSRQNNNSGS
jgi:hypothetical protein